jgi:ribosomal protein L16/L10AE
VRDDTAREALRLASHKLPCSTRVLERVHEAV